MRVTRVLAGRYELVRFVGRGGMGEVWEGSDPLIGRRVAVKLLPRTRHDDAATALFFREARTAGALRHPGVVTIHDLGRDEADGSLFLVMEFLTGRDLATVLREEGPPPVTTAVDWTTQTVDALAAAHDAGVLHRDLKPAIMMLTDDGRITLLDFGIARFAETTRNPSAVMGTPAYMPPERFDGDHGDARSDLYSLGCVLHELLTGTVPFDTPSLYGVMDAHRRTPPTPPSRHRPGLPPVIDALVLDLLAKDPNHRPATAQEVRHRLLRSDAKLTATAIATGQPHTTKPTDRPGKAWHRRWLLVSAVGCLAALLVVLFVVFVPDGDKTGATQNTPGTGFGASQGAVARPVPVDQLPARQPQSVAVTGHEGRLQVTWEEPRQSQDTIGYIVAFQAPDDGTVTDSVLIESGSQFVAVADSLALCAVVKTVIRTPQGTQTASSDPVCLTALPPRQT